MKYSYYNHWVPSTNKRGKGQLSYETAKKRFEKNAEIGEIFYVLIGDEIKPKYLIEYICKDLITISLLNKNLESIIRIEYSIPYNLNEKKLFLKSVLYDYFNSNYEQTKSKYVLFIDANYNQKHTYNKDSYIWSRRSYPWYREIEFSTEEQETGQIDVKIDETYFWRDYPRFGDWDWMIKDIEIMKEANYV